MNEKTNTATTDRLMEMPQHIPDPPHEIKRIPGFAEWHRRLEEWWYDVRTVLIRTLEE